MNSLDPNGHGVINSESSSNDAACFSRAFVVIFVYVFLPDFGAVFEIQWHLKYLLNEWIYK